MCILKKGRNATKHNLFTYESYSKAHGHNFDNLSIAHWETPEQGNLFWKDKYPTQHIQTL